MNQALFENIAYSSIGHRTSQEETYDIAKIVLERGIPGDFVECGVYAGASCALMAHAILESDEYACGLAEALRSYNPVRIVKTITDRRRVHLFDSFTGIPKPGPEDHELSANVGGESSCSMRDVEINMERWGVPPELLRYHPGLFEHSLRDAEAELERSGIAFLRLDADLYSSTLVAMQWLYPLVSKGGYILVDDYDLSGCRKAVHEVIHPAPVLWRKWN